MTRSPAFSLFVNLLIRRRPRGCQSVEQEAHTEIHSELVLARVAIFALFQEDAAVIDLPENAPAITGDDANADTWLYHESRSRVCETLPRDISAGSCRETTDDHLGKRPGRSSSGSTP